ncbi:hypothetical protein [Francisella salina]|uniref:Uncharacterized protein n=1 Tax=Francisella salina TaxID=573569 RepID=A0ABN3ZNU9_FRAST|nr:hypothetical protein [Francisella salina]AEI36582.1 hypothetical protein F7308_1658 [Francisella salina]
MANFIIFLIMLLLFLFKKIEFFFENIKIKTLITIIFLIIYSIAHLFAEKTVNIIIYNSTGFLSDNFIITKGFLVFLYSIFFTSLPFYALSLLTILLTSLGIPTILEQKNKRNLQKIKDFTVSIVILLGSLSIIFGYILLIEKISSYMTNNNIKNITIFLDFSREIEGYKTPLTESLILKNGDILVYTAIDGKIHKRKILQNDNRKY